MLDKLGTISEKQFSGKKLKGDNVEDEIPCEMEKYLEEK